MSWATQRLDPYLIWLCCRSSKGKGKGRKGGGKGSKKGKGKGKAWRNWDILKLLDITWCGQVWGWPLIPAMMALGPCDHARLVLCTLWSCPRLGFKEFLPEPLPFHHGFTIRLPSSKSPFLRAPLWVFHIILLSSLHVALTSCRANPKPSPMRAWWLASPSARGIRWGPGDTTNFGTKFGILSIVVFSCQAPCQAFVPYPWASSFVGKIRIRMSGYLPVMTTFTRQNDDSHWFSMISFEYSISSRTRSWDLTICLSEIFTYACQVLAHTYICLVCDSADYSHLTDS